MLVIHVVTQVHIAAVRNLCALMYPKIFYLSSSTPYFYGNKNTLGMHLLQLKKFSYTKSNTNHVAMFRNQKFHSPLYQCEICCCLLPTNNSILGEIFERHSMSCWTFSLFLALVFIVTSNEKPDSHR